jgi:DNA-binding response OmpR family regulator
MGAERRVLVVDDNDDVNDMMQMTLAEAGFESIAARDGAVARDLLRTMKFDVAIVDAILPGEPGIDLAEHIAGLGIPVVLISGDPGTIEKLPATRFPHVIKPFRMAELVEVLDVAVAIIRI